MAILSLQVKGKGNCCEQGKQGDLPARGKQDVGIRLRQTALLKASGGLQERQQSSLAAHPGRLICSALLEENRRQAAIQGQGVMCSVEKLRHGR